MKNLKIPFIFAVLSLSACLVRDDGSGLGSAQPLGSCVVNLSASQITGEMALGRIGAGHVVSQLAQSFRVLRAQEFPLNVDLALKKYGRPSGYIFVSLQKSSGGLPEGTGSSVGNSGEGFNGLPDGNPIAGGRVDTADINETDRVERLTVSLDHGTLSATSSSGRALAQAEEMHETMSLPIGQYWIVLQSHYPVNSTDFVTWVSNDANALSNGYSLARIDLPNIKNLWSLTPTGMNRDMNFAFGCKK